MEYRWNPEVWTEAVALPAAVVDRHIRLAGPTQLKVLLWLARRGQGTLRRRPARRLSVTPPPTARMRCSIGWVPVC